LTRQARLHSLLDAEGLVALGALPADPAHCSPEMAALVLVGPSGGAGFWDIITASAEWADGHPDPVDRWSKRVLGEIARHFGGAAIFPSDGPPWPPFMSWALQSGRAWSSPVGMLVHAQAGLWLSFRGALALPFALDLPPLSNPCENCAERPCLSACPVGALSAAGYDVAACHRWLDDPGGESCMAGGCHVRAACPVSKSHARSNQQSAYHMRQFHK
jgi:epoxyqueuosine reductase